MALHRNEPPDAEEPRLVATEGHDSVLGADPVVNDLEVALVEPLDLREIAREALRDGDVHVGERRDRAIRKPEEPALAEPVEAVLRREAEWNTS